MWQNAADDDLRRRPSDSRRPDRLEPCRTVTGRPGWPSWNPPDVELEASAAPVAVAWCGRTVERPTPNVQPHSGQTAAGSSDLRRCRKTVSCGSPGDTKWTPGPASLRSWLTDRTSGRHKCHQFHNEWYWRHWLLIPIVFHSRILQWNFTRVVSISLWPIDVENST